MKLARKEVSQIQTQRKKERKEKVLQKRAHEEEKKRRLELEELEDRKLRAAREISGCLKGFSGRDIHDIFNDNVPSLIPVYKKFVKECQKILNHEEREEKERVQQIHKQELRRLQDALDFAKFGRNISLAD